MEKLISQLAQAADRGIDASSSATALRNIYLKAKASGLTYAQAIEEVKKSQDGLGKSNELFGVRASVVGVTLADTTKRAEELEIALNNAGGTAERVALEQMDTLDGALKEQDAAWEALALSIGDSETALGGFVRTATENLTGIIKGVTLMNTSFEDLADTQADKFMKDLSASITGMGDEAKDTEKVRAELTKWVSTFAKKSKTANDEFNALGGSVNAIDKFSVAVGFEGGGFDADARRILLEEQAQGYQIAANRAMELLTSEEALAAFMKEATSTVEGSNEKKKEEIIIREDLIKLKQAEIKAAQDVIAVTRAETGARESKVNKLKEELAALKALGTEKRMESIGIDLIDTDAEVNAAKKAADEKIKINFDANQKIKEDNERAAEERKELINQGKELAIETAGAILANSITTNAQRVDDAIAKNREELNTNLADENLNEDQRAVLKAEADVREVALKKKRVKAERKDAIFQVGINAIVAASKTLATLGVPLGLIPAGIALATGVAQAAVIAAKPLPEFDKGVLSAPSGGFWAGEKRPEFMINKGQLSFHVRQFKPQ